MEKGRDLFIKLLRGETLTRPAFIPLIRGLAARVGGISMENLYSDPTLWANCIVKTVNLLELDGVVVGFDFTLMAEACGCEITWENDRPVISGSPTRLSEIPEEKGRMKNGLEAARRVFEICHDQRACVTAITGPVTLADQIFGPLEGTIRLNGIKNQVTRILEAFCQTRPDLIVFMEGPALAQSPLGSTQRRLYNTIKNIANYYNISTALYLEGYDVENLTHFSSLMMDFYILGPSRYQSFPPLSEIFALETKALGVGIGLPLGDFKKAMEIIHQGMEQYRNQKRKGFFLTSFGPVTRNTNLEVLRQLIQEIYQLQV